MADDFDKLSKQIVDDSGDVKKSLEDITKAAEDTDKAFEKLSKTQKSSLEISDRFLKALNKSNDALVEVRKAGVKAALGFRAAERSLKSVTTSMSEVGKGSGIAAESFDRAGDSADTFASLVERSMAGAAAASTSYGTKTKKALDSTTKEFKDLKDVLDKTTKSMKVELDGLAHAVDEVSVKRRVELTMEIAGKEGLSKYAESIDDAVAQVEALKKGATSAAAAAKLLQDEGEYAGRAIESAMEGARQKMLKVSELKKVAEAMGRLEFSDVMRRQLKEAGDELEVLEANLDSVANQKRYIDVSVKVKQMEAFADVADGFDEAQKEALALSISTGHLDEELAKAAADTGVLGVKMAKAYKMGAETAREATSVTVKLNKELDRQAKTIGGLIKKSFIEGKKEALEFAGGLGESAKGLTAAGLAAYFLAQKVEELARALGQTAVDIASFNVGMTMMGKTIMGATTESLEKMKKNLSLTMGQASEFFEVVKEGANTLGLTQGQMEETAKALQDTFGGDPTKRLREYVDLLKEIPTLEMDLQVGADLDDKAASLFALAKRGKVDVAMELQTAGLLGGDQGEEVPGAEMLKAAQKAQYTTEAIGETLIGKMYPTWGPYLSESAAGVSKLVGYVGAVSAFLGGMQMFLGTAQNRTTAAVEIGSDAIVRAVEASGGSSSLPGKAKPGRVFKKVGGKTPGVGRVARRAALKYGGKGAAQSVMKFEKVLVGLSNKYVPMVTKGFGVLEAKVVGVGSKLMSMGKAFNIAAVATVAVGLGAKYLEKKFKDSGNEIGEAASGAVGALAEIAGAAMLGATLGSVFGPIGTAVGAAAGAIAGLVMNIDSLASADEKMGKALTKTVNDFDGKPIQKYNFALVKLGKYSLEEAKVIREVISVTKAFGEKIGKGVKEMLGPVGDFISSLSGTDEAVYGFSAALVAFGGPMGVAAGVTTAALYTLGTSSLDYRRYLGKLSKQTKDTEAAFKGLSDAEKKWAPTQQKLFKEEVKSYQALQQSFKAVDAAVHSAKMEIYDFNKEVAMVDVSGISELGGSSAVFAAAVGDASDAVKGKFEALTKSLDAQRRDIMANDTFSPSERKKALANLNKVEMDAAREFADGIKSVINALYKSPEAIVAGLKRETEQVKIDTSAEAGAASTEDIVASVKKQNEETEKAYAANADAKRKVDAEVAKEEAVIAANRETAIKELAAMYDRADEKGKAALEGSVEKVKTGKGDETKTVAASSEKLATEYEKVSGASRDLFKRQEELKNSLPKTLLPMAKKVGELKESIKKGSDSLEEIKGLKKDADPYYLKEQQDKEKAVMEERNAQEKELAELQKQLNSAMESVGANAGTSVDSTKLAAYLSALAAANGKMSTEEAEKWAAEMPGMSEAMKKITENGYKNADETVKQLDAVNKQLTASQVLEDTLKKAVGVTNLSVSVQDSLNTVAKEFAKEVQGDRSVQKSLLENRGGQIVSAEEELAASKKRLEIAKKMGGGADEIADVLEKETKVVQEEAIDLKKREVFAREILAAREKAVDGAKSELELAKKAKESAKASGDTKAYDKAASRVKVLEDELGNLSTRSGIAKETVQELDKKMAEIASNMPMVGSSTEKALQELEGTSEMVGARIQSELGDVLADMAPYAEDVGKYADESFKAASEGARKTAELQKKMIKMGLKRDLENIAARLKMGQITPEQAKGQENIANAKAEAEFGKAELNSKRGVVDAAKRSVQLRMEELDVVQGGIDAQMEIAEAFDGSAESIRPLLRKQLSVEKDRLKELKKQAEVSRQTTGDSLETRKLELEVVKKEGELRKREYDNVKKVIDLRREEVNMQQDMMETEMDFLQEFGGSLGAIQDMQAGIVGMEREKLGMAREELDAAVAAGAEGKVLMEAQMNVRKAEISLAKKSLGAQKSIMDRMLGAAFGQISGVGGQKGIGSVQSELGVAGTRVQYKSGLYGSGAGGDLGTIEQRAFKAQMGSGKQSMFAAPGAKKDKMEGAMEDVRKGTDATAENTKGLGVAGSAYVHDIHSEGILSDILGVMKRMADSVMGIAPAVKDAVPSGKDEAKAVKDTGVAVQKAVESGGTAAGVAADVEVAGALGDQLKIAKKEWKLAKDAFQLAKKENRLGKKEYAAVEQSTEKLKALEGMQRKLENESPIAGAFDFFEDAERVLSGKMAPEVEALSKEMAGAANNTADAAAIESVKKVAQLKGVEVTKVGIEKEAKSWNKRTEQAAKDMAAQGVSADKVAAWKKKEMEATEYARKTLLSEADKISGAKAKSETKSGAGGKKSEGAGLAGGGKAIPLGSKAGIKGMAMVTDMAERHAKAFGKSVEKESKTASKTVSNEAVKSVTAGFKSESDTFNKPGAYEAQRQKDLAKASSKVGEMSETMVAGQKTMSETMVSGKRGAGSVEEIMPPGGAGAAASGAASDGAITIKGDIKVHFDTKMFRMEVATIVTEQAKNPDFMRALANSGFITVHQ